MRRMRENFSIDDIVHQNRCYFQFSIGGGGFDNPVLNGLQMPDQPQGCGGYEQQQTLNPYMESPSMPQNEPISCFQPQQDVMAGQGYNMGNNTQLYGGVSGIGVETAIIHQDLGNNITMDLHHHDMGGGLMQINTPLGNKRFPLPYESMKNEFPNPIEPLGLPKNEYKPIEIKPIEIKPLEIQTSLNGIGGYKPFWEK